MNEHENNPIPPEENASQSMDEQSGNVDLSNDESIPWQNVQYPLPPQYYEQPYKETSGSGCLGVFIKTILIILAIIAFAFFACLFMLSGPC